MDQTKCMGCGSILQTEDDKVPGYIKQSLLDRGDEDLMCQRCFRLKHYREIMDVDLSNEEFVKILTEIASQNALIVNVIDIFDISGSLISGIQRFIGNNDVILVGNKRDILPKSMNDNKISNWVRHIIKDYGYKVVDVALVSAAKGHGLSELLEMIEEHRNGRDVYIIGCTNVGKSTLVNAIIKQFTDNKEDLITVSQFPGTTLGLIEIPLNDTNDLIDTPGIINLHQYAFYLDKGTLKHILPQKEIKPKAYQLDSKQTLFFDGLARFDFVSGNKTSFICYFSNEIKIHRTKLENADQLFEKHIGGLLSPPSVSEFKNMGKYVKHHFKTTRDKCDIVISGLGFITINAPNLQIAVWTPKNVGVFIRPSLF